MQMDRRWNFSCVTLYGMPVMQTKSSILYRVTFVQLHVLCHRGPDIMLMQVISGCKRAMIFSVHHKPGLVQLDGEQWTVWYLLSTGHTMLYLSSWADLCSIHIDCLGKTGNSSASPQKILDESSISVICLHNTNIFIITLNYFLYLIYST